MRNGAPGPNVTLASNPVYFQHFRLVIRRMEHPQGVVETVRQLYLNCALLSYKSMNHYRLLVFDYLYIYKSSAKVRRVIRQFKMSSKGLLFDAGISRVDGLGESKSVLLRPLLAGNVKGRHQLDDSKSRKVAKIIVRNFPS